MEKDLSQKQDLNVIILRRTKPSKIPQPLPDGMDELADYNLLIFKSHQETLTLEALKDLVAYYVNYRKHVSPTPNDLLPESAFRLMACCVHYPQQLAAQVPWQERSAGVYDCAVLGMAIRVIVTQQVPQKEQNAFWHLFSAVPEQVLYGAAHYPRNSPDTSMLLQEVLRKYREDGFVMPDAVNE